MIFWSTVNSPANTNSSETRRAAGSNACFIFRDTTPLCRRKGIDERSECKPGRAQPSSDEARGPYSPSGVAGTDVSVATESPCAVRERGGNNWRYLQARQRREP